MSTDLKSSTPNVFLTQFSGPEREDGGDRRKLQVTLLNCNFRAHPAWLQLTREEARSFALDLLSWSEDRLEEDLD